MKTLTEQEIIRLMREEWDAKLSLFAEDVGLTLTKQMGNKTVQMVPDQIRITHKDSGLSYTVVGVTPNGVHVVAYDPPKKVEDEAGKLMTSTPPQDPSVEQPQPVELSISKEELQKNYRIGR